MQAQAARGEGRGVSDAKVGLDTAESPDSQPHDGPTPEDGRGEAMEGADDAWRQGWEDSSERQRERAEDEGAAEGEDNGDGKGNGERATAEQEQEVPGGVGLEGGQEAGTMGGDEVLGGNRWGVLSPVAFLLRFDAAGWGQAGERSSGGVPEGGGEGGEEEALRRKGAIGLDAALVQGLQVCSGACMVAVALYVLRGLCVHV